MGRCTYYNAIDPYAAEWLENLVREGHIAKGVVDRRDIRAIPEKDIAGFQQCHFFAGIGGWPLALRLAGWPNNIPVWTGSCPCQPFSSAGKRRGTADERHLWPAWFRLIRECRPAIIFGEQVASPDGLGWFDLVSADLEGEGYAVGAADLCAAGIGAPHIRQRLFFVAVADWERREKLDLYVCEEVTGSGSIGDLADTEGARCLSGRAIEEDRGSQIEFGRFGKIGPWRVAEWIQCRDGKSRPIEPGSFPLANGIPARVGRLRAYGNAIVPQVAAMFVRGVMDGGL